MLLTKR